MVDSTQATEKEYINVDFVKQSPTKRVQIVNGGQYDATDFGTKLTLPVIIDGKEKKYRPNSDSASNMTAAWGKDTVHWTNKEAILKVLKGGGKEMVIADPVTVPTETISPQPTTTPEGGIH